MADSHCPTSVRQTLAMSDEEIARVDPVAMNLIVAKGIPSLADVDIGKYVALADKWAADVRKQIPGGDARFRKNPRLWQNDLDFSRLALLCWYIGEVLRVRYREDQRNGTRIHYTDPNDLFLCGVMDTKQGTCGTMAALYVALCWRLGWPVSLACIRSHYIARFDDGKKTFNIEATTIGAGGSFSSPTDSDFIRDNKLPDCAITCGSELRAVTPREMLGLFLGLRARHLENTTRFEEAERDYLLARHLFPQNRNMYIAQNQISVQTSMKWFEPGEKGHPTELANWLQQVVTVAPWRRFEHARPQTRSRKGRINGNPLDGICGTIIVG